MDFYEQLNSIGLTRLLRDVAYESPRFMQQERLFAALDEIVTNNLYLILVSDCDVDGISCIKVVEGAFNALGFRNYRVAPYIERTHRLSTHAVYLCLQSNCDYVLICDTGSSDVQLINRLVNEGKKVIVLDHHLTQYDYDFYSPNVIMVNTTIENHHLGINKYQLSAGALVYCVFEAYLRHKGITNAEQLVAYAAISLFADCMDMGNDLNRSIYYRAKALEDSQLPDIVKLFMEDKALRFNSRFINYTFSPKINAAFRSENLGVLNTLLLPGHSAGQIASAYERLKLIYEASRQMVEEAVDTLQTQVEKWQHFVVCDLRGVEPYISIENERLYNYTGLIANKFASRYGKIAFVYCSLDNDVKGSVRDPLGRCVLPLFQQLCYAGGHGAAFGTVANKLDFPGVMKMLHYIDTYSMGDFVTNKPLLVDWPYATLDANVVQSMLRVSELGGQSVPKLILRKKMIGMRESTTSYGYCYTCGTGSDQFKFYAKHKLNFCESYLFELVQKQTIFFSQVEE